MNFEKEIEKGNFVLGECSKCKKTVWPPSEYCNACFGEVIPKRGDFVGRIVEFSKKDNDYFCLVEFENQVRIIGKISVGTPTKNQKISVKKCGIKDKNYFFEFILIS